MKQISLSRHNILLSERRSKRHPHLNPLPSETVSQSNSLVQQATTNSCHQGVLKIPLYPPLKKRGNFLQPVLIPHDPIALPLFEKFEKEGLGEICMRRKANNTLRHSLSRERKLDHFVSGDSLINLSTSPGHVPNASCCFNQGRKNVGLRLKIGKKTAAAILVFLWMVLPGLGSAAERKTDLRITYSSPRISVEARGISLLQVLRDISIKVGFDLTDYGIPDRDLTVSIQEVTVEEILRQLLRGENYGIVYREKEGAISKVLLLSSPDYAQAAPISENQQTRTEAIRGREGLTVFSATPADHQPARPEQKRENRAESEPRVEDILRVHAISGLAAPDTFLQRLTPNVPQPLGNSTPAFPPTGAASSNTPSLGDMNDSLAMTTRLAQQNLKALADGLATATHSLLNYRVNK